MSNYHQYALLIGIGQRADDEDALATTASDATHLYEKLTGTCGFAKENVELLTKENTAGSKIVDQLDVLIQQTKDTKADFVLIYFSGHGYTKDGQYYLINYDTDKNNIENTAINGEVFISKVNSVNTAKLLLLLDCCHAGGFAGADKVFIPFKESDFINHTNRVIITSSEKWEKSFTAEPVSVFTYALIEGLHGKDLLNDKSKINVFDLALYVRERTRALTKNAQNPGFTVLPQSFTENFTIVDYQNKKPEGLAFEAAFKLYKDGKHVVDVAKGFSEGVDREFRELWCRQLKIDEADIAFVSVKEMNVEKAVIEDVTFKNARVDVLDITDKAKEEIIQNGLLPLKIRIEKDKVVYGWKKNIDGRIKDEETQVVYSDADLHLSVSDFFIKWAKATQDYDETTETNFQILGKLLARFIDLESQLNKNLNLSQTLFLEPGKNIVIRIAVMLEIKNDAGVLCNLPWEYLYVSEKDKESITGKRADYTKKYPSFFLSADKGLQFQFVRQTKRNAAQQVSNNKFSIVVLNYAGLSAQDLTERMNKMKGKNDIEVHEIPPGFFKNIGDFQKNYFTYIKEAIHNKWITENYVLHYIGETKIENGDTSISFVTENGGLEFVSSGTFAGVFEQNETEKYVNQGGVNKILPLLIFLDADDSAKITVNNNSAALHLSYNDIPAVIGFQDKLPAEARDEFIGKLYNGIAMGMDVAQAVTIARQSLKFSEGPADHAKKLYLFGIPVLFISTEIPVKLVDAGNAYEEAKKEESTTGAVVKYCQFCGKERSFSNDKLMCDKHRTRLQEYVPGATAETQQGESSSAQRQLSGSRNQSESLSAKQNNG
jgi:Caspase domain